MLDEVKLNFNLDAVGDIDNDPILGTIETMTGYYSIKIAEKIQNHHIYKQVASLLHSEKLFFYFQRHIAIEIRPYILQAFSIKRGCQKYRSSKSYNGGVCVPYSGIYPLLKKVWTEDEVPIFESFKMEMIDIKYRAMRGKARELLDQWKSHSNSGVFKKLSNENSRIVVLFGEGFDINRRSDLVWYINSGIDPKRILVYFDGNTLYEKGSIDHFLKQLEDYGIEWISTERGGVKNGRKDKYWVPSQASQISIFKLLGVSKDEISDTVGKWTLRHAEKLLKRVHFWKTFYQTFNVKLLFLPTETYHEIIAQGIAFDTMGEQAGFTIGKQRSEVRNPSSCMTGMHIKDIFFSWNCRFKKYLTPGCNHSRTQVISGYPNDSNFLMNNDEAKNNRKQLMKNGAAFIIALFDQNYVPELEEYSVIPSFYRAFFDWVLEDNSIGIVIKSKNPEIWRKWEKLVDMLPLLAKAKATGRCIRLSDEKGRLPSDAARSADIAVGIGVSTAVTESVLSGCRGIHYHKSYARWHEYYKWGYGKLVFDDLDEMIAAIKRYKNNPDSNKELGNWEPYLSMLDPFRDGRAGERMGMYMRWCLEGFDKGLTREAVLKSANIEYAEIWGKDKLIELW